MLGFMLPAGVALAVLAVLLVVLCCYKRSQYDTQALRLANCPEPRLDDEEFLPSRFSDGNYPIPPEADAALLPADVDIGSQAFPSVTDRITSEFEYASD